MGTTCLHTYMGKQKLYCMCTDMHAHMHLHTLDHQIDWVNQTIATVCARMLTMKQWLRVSFILSLLKSKIQNIKKHFFPLEKKRYTRAEHFAYIVSSLDLLVSRKRKLTYSCCHHIGRRRRRCLVGCVYCYYFVFVFVLLLLTVSRAYQRTNSRKDMWIIFRLNDWNTHKQTHTHTYKQTYLKWKANRRTIFQSSLKSVDRSWCRLFSLLNRLCWSILKNCLFIFFVFIFGQLVFFIQSCKGNIY